MILKHFIQSSVKNNKEDLQLVSIVEESYVSSEQEVNNFIYYRYG